MGNSYSLFDHFRVPMKPGHTMMNTRHFYSLLLPPTHPNCLVLSLRLYGPPVRAHSLLWDYHFKGLGPQK